MNKITVFLLVIITALSFILGSTVQSKAQNKGFAGVVPFISNTDRLGFFDQNTGRIYMYDNNFSQCVYVGQMQGLGQAIQEITKTQ